MYLIDTSVWISYLKGESNDSVEAFSFLLEKKASLGLSSIIYQEIIQGAATEKEFIMLSDYLRTQKFYHPKNSIESYQNAAQLYFRCRKSGFTVRSSIDCLIAQTAIDNDLILLHNDRDYLKIAQANPELKLLSELTV